MPEQTFFQRRCTNGQQVCEKLLNITAHQGEANQTTIRDHLVSVGTAIIKKPKITRVDQDVEKRKSSFYCECTEPLNWLSSVLSSTKSFPSIPWEVQNILLEMKVFFFPLLLHFFEAHIQAIFQRMNNPENSPGRIILTY